MLLSYLGVASVERESLRQTQGNNFGQPAGSPVRIIDHAELFALVHSAISHGATFFFFFSPSIYAGHRLVAEQS